ncbi:hypothetical protein LTR09_002455 [Extremus antarcticus]|uniref:Uncharacterized protein n=1 Tax=Extremus antarcticus TaxID=702011 RepID=A0AAJ0LV89_9PEZI|nr:hypothetical protein LTR09_002455 [Extremus antarcticus]
MQFLTTTMLAISAIFAAASAAPTLNKRQDTCTMTGVESDTQSTCGTVGADVTGLVADIDWSQDWKTGGYVGCHVGFDGWVIEGVVGGSDVVGGGGVTTDTYECAVTFNI